MWPIYTQRILADDVQLGLKGFGASLTAQTIAPGDGMESVFTTLICGRTTNDT